MIPRLLFFNSNDGRLRAGWRLLAQQLVLVFALLLVGIVILVMACKTPNNSKAI